MRVKNIGTENISIRQFSDGVQLDFNPQDELEVDSDTANYLLTLAIFDDNGNRTIQFQEVVQ